MSDFKTAVPASVAELTEYLEKLQDNRSHIKSIKVDHSMAAILVDLSWKANKLGGYPDVAIPIVRGRLAEAEQMVTALTMDTNRGASLTDTQISQLFNMIDQGRG